MQALKDQDQRRPLGRGFHRGAPGREQRGSIGPIGDLKFAGADRRGQKLGGVLRVLDAQLCEPAENRRADRGVKESSENRA